MIYESHATSVVERFKKMLSEESIESVTEQHFEELETLVSAALGVVESQAQYDFAKRVDALAKELMLASSSSEN